MAGGSHVQDHHMFLFLLIFSKGERGGGWLCDLHCFVLTCTVPSLRWSTVWTRCRIDVVFLAVQSGSLVESKMRTDGLRVAQLSAENSSSCWGRAGVRRARPGVDSQVDSRTGCYGPCILLNEPEEKRQREPRNGNSASRETVGKGGGCATKHVRDVTLDLSPDCALFALVYNSSSGLPVLPGSLAGKQVTAAA